MKNKYWADNLIEGLDKTVHHRVDDMKTPSGHAHAGSMRAIATHALIYEAMKHAGFDVEFSYVVNDMDPMDGLPVYLDKTTYEPHMGKPLYLIPPPDGKSSNYAEQYANEYIGAFNTLNFFPEIVWSSKLYQSGVMDKWIRMALDGAEEIRKIYLKVAEQKKPEGWFPLQVICPKCQKVGSSLVTEWDGVAVAFECKKDLVNWAVGCGEKGKISPFGGTSKLMWKIDWPAHWAELNITVEGAGKDHLSAGGSHDIATEVAKKVFKKNPPFAFLHEFFLIGGAKMSSSKGNATTAAQLVQIVPPELCKFLFVRTPYQRAFNFNPGVADTIPDLFDEYDTCAKSWIENGDTTKQGRMYEASQTTPLTREKVFLPRFRVVAQLVQGSIQNPTEYFEKQKGSKLTETESKILEERVLYAKLWLKHFASQDNVFEVSDSVPEEVSTLTDEQTAFLKTLAQMLDEGSFADAATVQTALFEKIKESGLASKDAFTAIYIALSGKTQGPKAGLVLFSELQENKDRLLSRLVIK